ncbi:hypothetical protein CYY_003360 [Polysphondylium violaceum]|uniref:SLA1-like PH domain-containing protein n=1 Tax=Polysphondylium violaceum TaxID=133409 RepID=A0A8J4UUD1_9MYCE|nr:hypothetical protein CYY_003360 [Polysphondylium violaceum]
MDNIILTPIERKNIDIVLNQKNEDENYLQKIDVKGKKARKLFLLIGNNRLFFFKVGGKLEIDYHFLDILELKSDTPKDLQIKFRNDNGKEPLQFTVDSSKDTSEIILAVDYLFTLNFPGMKSNRLKIIIQPESRITDIYSSPNAITPEMGPCGGFTLTYFSMCDFMNIQPISEVSWHIDNVIVGSGIKEFDYGFFYKKDRLLGTDARPIMAALAINPYFTSFSIRGMKLSNECLLSIISLLSQNSYFEKLVLNGLGMDRSMAEKLIESLSANKALPLRELDLGNNPIEDKGMTSIADWLKSTNHHISSLILNNCSAGRSAMSLLCESLFSNENIHHHLRYLDIGGNKLETDGSTALSGLLAKSRCLSTLIVSNSTPQFHILKPCVSINKFDNSGNRVVRKDNIHRDMVNFLNHSIYLVDLNLSKCQIPIESINDIFGEGNLVKMETLNIADNDLGDEGITILADIMATHPSIRSLDISNNFNRRSKTRTSTIESIINMIERKSKTHNSIRSLFIQGASKSQLKGDLLPIICCLFYNTNLKEIDISGHQAGDIVAASIGKLLQSNSSLTKLYFDDNSVSVRGLNLVKIGLSRNSSMLHMPLPIKDIASALKSDANPLHLTRMTEVCNEIQQTLLDNYVMSKSCSKSFTKPRSNSNPLVADPKSTINTCAGLKSFISDQIDISEPLANLHVN